MKKFLVKISSKHIVAVIDAGGRGAALVAAYCKSRHVSKVIAIPGNDLMKLHAGKKQVKIFPEYKGKALKTTSVEEILEICKKEKVTMIDVAQDNAIAVGLSDNARELGFLCASPTQSAGEIESSKAFARDLGIRYGLPQPTFQICTSEKEGVDFLKKQPKDSKWFIKASGLAEGKGALPAESTNEAIERVKEMKRFGESGEVYLIEETLVGEEFSLFAVSDGKNYKIIGSAQDHKRVNTFDIGENTGGMGCSNPPLLLSKDLIAEVKKTILDKVFVAMREEERAYQGILYLGGIVVKKGNKFVPYIIEFNARWGDPEAQVMIPSLQCDLVEMNMAIINGEIKSFSLKTDTKSRVVVTGASKGYPGDYSDVKGKEIFGLPEAMKMSGVQVFGAGVLEKKGRHFANGGRLFYIVGEGKNVIESREKAYAAMNRISIEGNNLHYRTDIGWRDVARLRKKK